MLLLYLRHWGFVQETWCCITNDLHTSTPISRSVSGSLHVRSATAVICGITVELDSSEP